MGNIGRNLIFMGLKHSGKTTFSKRIAERLFMRHVDLDEEIERKNGNLKARDIYRAIGKEAFDELQEKSLSEILENDERLVISLGGGASDSATLMRLAKERGYSIYLYRREEDLIDVILRHGLPAFLDSDDPRGSFSKIFSRRDRIYRENADLIIDLGPYRDKDETEELIFQRLKEEFNGI